MNRVLLEILIMPQLYMISPSVEFTGTKIPLVSQISPIHNVASYFFKLHLNIILHSKPRSSKFSFPTFPYKYHACNSLPSQACYMPCQSDPPLIFSHL